MRLPATLLFLLVFASPSLAGAWMRDEGTGFLSFSAAAARDTNASGAGTAITQTFYAEYGLGQRLTLGANAWSSDRDRAAYVFLRHPLSEPKASRKLALELAFGAFKTEGQSFESAQRLGFSVGQGFATGWGPGWVQLDASYEYRETSRVEVLKVDATLGVSHRKDRKAIVQVFAEQNDGDPLTLTLSPSYLRRVTPSAHLVLGADYDVSGGNQVGLRIGTWLEF